MLTSAYLVLYEKVDALNRFTVQDLKSGTSFRVDFPEEVYCVYPKDVSSLHYFNANMIRFGYSSPTTPASVFDYTIPTKERVCVKVQEIPSGHNPADYRVFRLNATSPDGQLVPIFVLHHSKIPPTSSSPLYV
jgi:oligopeptidase B